MDQSLLDLLNRIVPGVSWSERVVDTPHGGVHTIELPVPAESDYRFNLHLYPGGEKGISADRVGSSEGEYFWHKQFELADYRDEQELDADFLRVVEALLTRETMILQKKGLFWTTFRLAFRAGEHAYLVNFVAAPRMNFRAPNVGGRKHVYKSKPLGDDRSQDSAPDVKSGGMFISLFGG